MKEIYFGGGSPTYYNNEDFGKLVEKLKSKFDFSKLGDFTVEIDPRRVDEKNFFIITSVG